MTSWHARCEVCGALKCVLENHVFTMLIMLQKRENYKLNFMEIKNYLLNVCLIPRSYRFRANSRVRWWQVDCETCGWCYSFRINWRRFGVSSHITSFVADGRWRLCFTVNCRSRWNVSLCVEIFSIGIWLCDECWTATRWAV